MASTIPPTDDHSQPSVADALLAANYSHRQSLLQVLSQLSPQVGQFISAEFEEYLRSTIVATNYDLQSKLDATSDIPSIEIQKDFIHRFGKPKQGVFLNLFNALIGNELTRFIQQFCSIFQKNQAENCLFQVHGSTFRYKLSTKNKHDADQMYSAWSEISSPYSDIIDSLQNNCTTEQMNVNCAKKCPEIVLNELKEDRARENSNWLPKQSTSQISRHKLFYSRISTGKTQSQHASLNDNCNSVLQYAKKSIYGDYFKHLKHLRQRSHSKIMIEELVKKVHQTYVECNVRGLLKKHCPLPSNADFDMEQALQMNTPHKNLFAFMYALYYHIFPMELFGGKQNQRKFFDNLKHFFTASFAVKFRIHDLAHGMELEQMKHLFKALRIIYPTVKGLEVRFLYWIFECMACLMKSNFYITENARTCKNSLLFYRFDLWARISKRALQQYTNEQKWQLSSTRQSRDKCESFADYLQYSAHRLLPKRASLRHITRLKFYHDFGPYKRQLNNIRLLLKKVKELTALDKDDQFGFKWSLHNKIFKIKTNPHNGPFYVCRGDFKDCYPSIRVEYLLNFVEEKLPLLAKGYLPNGKLHVELIRVVKKRGNFYANMDDLIVHSPDTANRSLFKNNLPTLNAIVDQQLGGASRSNCVLYSDGTQRIKLSSVIDHLKIYLQNACFRLGKKTMCQLTSGIRQGGTLSSDLCDIYLNYLWRQYFADFLLDSNESNQFFIKTADDFLFVSTDCKKAQQFATIVSTGFAEFNLKVNSDKFFTNFDIETGTLKEDCLTFLGRRIFAQDLTVGMDLDAFANQRIVDTFNCNPFLPVMDIMKSLIGSLPQMCYPEMFDCTISHKERVVLNIFNCFLLQASRFASFVCVSPKWKSCHQLSIDICILIYRMSKRLSGLISKWKRTWSAMQCPLSRLNILYIAASAFRLLWTKGPHKLRCRVAERKAINYFCQILQKRRLHRLKNSECIQLPNQLAHPFDRVYL